MTVQQLRIIIALFLLSSTVNAAYAESDGFIARAHPRDLFRRVGDTPPPPPSIVDHVKDHLAKEPLTIQRGSGSLTTAFKDRPTEKHRQDTFHGTVPVLGGAGKVTAQDLNQYAKGGYESAELHKPERQGSNHVMGAAHRDGSDTVHLASNPKGLPFYRGDYSVKSKTGGPHAETAAVSHGIAKEGSTSGWTVGQHGHFDDGNLVKEPCKECQKTLGNAGVTYRTGAGDIIRPPSPNSAQHPVAGSSAQGAQHPPAHQDSATAEKRKASKSPTPEKGQPPAPKKKH